MMKKILVTGGAGFIGSHTVDLLLTKGMHVIVYDNLSTGKLSYLDQTHPYLRIVHADILDESVLTKEIAACDAVLHLAALASVPKSIENPVQSMETNTLGFLHVLQAIRASKKPIRLVYASSAAIYGSVNKLPCNDRLELSEVALSPYALEKANNERYASLYSRLFGIQSLGLRYFNVYGPRQDPASPYSGVISKFMTNYMDNLPIVVFGDGRQTRDFIHVQDVARANWLALQSTYYGALNIATGVPETLINLIRYIEAAGNHSAEIRFTAARSGDIRESYGQVDLAKKQLRFQHEIGLKEGISAFLFNPF